MRLRDTLIVALVAGVLPVAPAHANFFVDIDSFNVGSFNLSSADNVKDTSTETGLPGDHVVDGYRYAEVQGFSALQTTLVGGSGSAQLTLPTNLTQTLAFFRYNDGQLSIPGAGGINLSLTDFVAFHVDIDQYAPPANVMNLKFTAIGNTGNSKFTTRALTGPGIQSFTLADLGGSPGASVHTIIVELSGVTSGLNGDQRLISIDSIYAEYTPEPATAALLMLGSLVALRRRGAY